jgi:uncharacterized protein
MIYLDTSVLVPLFVSEPESDAVRHWFARQQEADLTISDWTLTEFASAMGIKVREKGLSADRALKATGLMENLAMESLHVLTPTRADYTRARQMLMQHQAGLRAGDALHLAVAEGEGVEAVYSLDKRFIKAGQKLKIKTASPI